MYKIEVKKYEKIYYYLCDDYTENDVFINFIDINGRETKLNRKEILEIKKLNK